MYKILIVEDDEQDASLLTNTLNQYASKKGKQFNIDVYNNGNLFLNKQYFHYDIIFLDIEMSSINGIDIAKEIRKSDEDVPIIFVTNMAQFAIDGYAVHAYSYILKPVTYESIALKLERLLQMIDSKQFIKIDLLYKGVYHVVDSPSILYIEIINHSLIYHTTKGNYNTYGKLKDVCTKLEPYGFFRCNNCFLVNLRFIESVSGFEATLSNGEKILISQNRRKMFLSVLSNYLGRMN